MRKMTSNRPHIASIFATLFVMLPIPSLAETNFHLYVYNECKSDVEVTATYFPIGKDQKTSTTTSVRSGFQQMVAVSDRASFTISSKTTDKSWDTIEFNTKVSEYTHVLSCGCEGTECPNPWPGLAQTRQNGR
jgi:hypothetical protein